MSVIERERVEVPAKTEVTKADVLERAAYRLEEEIDEWCQGSFFRAEGQACASWAIYKAEFDLGWTGPSWLDGPAYAALVKSLGLGRYGVPRWNDRPGRTKAEVIAAFRQAAAEARA